MTSIQGTAVVKRLRTGHTLALQLVTSGAELYQTVDAGGNVSPSWSASAAHPIITPQGRSLTAGMKGTLSDWTWKYLGNALAFSADGACTTSGYERLFKVNHVTAALEIVGNLASKTNVDNDTLTFSAKVTVDGVSAVIEKSIEVIIAAGGASSFWGNVSTDNAILDGSVSKTALRTTLMLGGVAQTNYTIDWYKNTKDKAHALSGFNPSVVTRNDVDGTTLFIADFKVDGNVVYTDGIVLTDQADEFYVMTEVSGDVTDTNTVTVKATLANTRTKEKATGIAAVKWTAYYYKVTAEQQASGEVNFANGKLDSHPIATKQGADVLEALVSLTATETGDSDVVVLFEAEFSV